MSSSIEDRQAEIFTRLSGPLRGEALEATLGGPVVSPELKKALSDFSLASLLGPVTAEMLPEESQIDK